ncbi:MAG TPA: CapA family protein [Polyangiaceae bacterium]|nr:CapA family protein [Polyangiaceae bacterium]
MSRLTALGLALLAVACGESGHSEVRARVTFVGDVLLDSAPGNTIRDGGDPFASVAQVLTDSDLSIANLECSVATTGERAYKEYTFRADPRTLTLLKRYVGVVSLANNHSGDYGPAALTETMKHLTERNIRFFGAGKDSQDAHSPLLVQARGVKLGLLGYDEYQPRWFEAGPNRPGVAWSEDEQVVDDIRAARARGAAVVIPFMHWGWEEEDEPTPRQRALAHRMIDAGADAVVGSHPHRVQGAEIYRDRPIVYSLGNFVFDLTESDIERLGWLLRVELDERGVRRWSTLLVRIDSRGSPALDRSAWTPCGTRGRVRVGRCLGGDWLSARW